MLPYVLLLVAAGYGWAHWDRALFVHRVGALLGVMVAWSGLHVATLWLNADFDQDEGEVLFGKSVPVPKGIAVWSYATLLASTGIAFYCGFWAGVSMAICAALAVAYSHPRLAWKAHAWGGPLVNVLGYGLLTPMAGFSVVEVPLNPRTVVVWLAAALGVLGTYFAAQAFQAEDDRARGYRTLVATHGPRVALQAARLCIVAGLVIGCGLAAIGWLPRVALVALPLIVWIDLGFQGWMRLPNGGDERAARTQTQRLLVSGLLTFALVFADYWMHMGRNQPVAGLATLAGHPEDRPMLSPLEMWRWEKANGRRLKTP